MTIDQYQYLVRQRLQTALDTLNVKGAEYIRNENPLHNFEKGARITGEHPAEVLDGFLLKHLISYSDMLKDLAEGRTHSEEAIREKFGDIINYFIIQEIIFLKETSKKCIG